MLWTGRAHCQRQVAFLLLCGSSRAAYIIIFLTICNKCKYVFNHRRVACFHLHFDRLQYFARGVQVYIKQLRAALQGKTGDALKTDEVCTFEMFVLILVVTFSNVYLVVFLFQLGLLSVVKFICHRR